jgi:putative heme iron utilization protein
VHNIVREAVKESIKEHLAKKEDVIRKQIDAEFRKSNSKIVRSLVENMGAAMADKFADSYRLNITFSTP